MNCPSCDSDHISIAAPDPLCVCLECGHSWQAPQSEVNALVCPVCQRRWEE